MDIRIFRISVSALLLRKCKRKKDERKLNGGVDKYVFGRTTDLSRICNYVYTETYSRQVGEVASREVRTRFKY